MLKHLPRSGMDFLYTFSIFPGLYISFLQSGRHLLLFPSIRWESFSTLLSSGLSLSSSASQKFLNASFYCVYSSFWSIYPFSLPARPVSVLDGLFLIKFFIFFGSFQMDLTNPILATIDFSKAFDSAWHSAFFHKLF